MLDEVSPSSGVPAGPRPRIIPAHPVSAALLMTVVVVFLWVLEFVDQAFVQSPVDPFGLDEYGIVPRSVDGLDGILFAPLLHGGFEHLASNTVPLFVLGFLVLAGGFGQFLAVTALIWLFGGAMTWLTGGMGFTVGASGIIFGWLAFLLVRGFFARSGRQIALAVVIFLLYGGVLWGVLPSDLDVSWQAHLFGAIGGVIAARTAVAADRAGNRELAGG